MHCYIAVCVCLLAKAFHAIMRCCRVAEDQRFATLLPLVGRAIAQPNVQQLQPVVIIQVVVEKRSGAEPLLVHLPGGGVINRTGVGRPDCRRCSTVCRLRRSALRFGRDDRKLW